jgi:hypothetical protein
VVEPFRLVNRAIQLDIWVAQGTPDLYNDQVTRNDMQAPVVSLVSQKVAAAGLREAFHVLNRNNLGSRSRWWGSTLPCRFKRNQTPRRSLERHDGYSGRL